MQLFSFLERRRSTAAKVAKVEVKEDKATELPSLFRSASMLRAKLSTRRVKRKNSESSHTESVETEQYHPKKDIYLSPTPISRPPSYIDVEGSRPRRKSEAMKRALRRLRSSSIKEERYDELVELACLLELKETESIQSVLAERNPQLCSSWETYRRSWEAEIIDPFAGKWGVVLSK